jgi:hypothetical protein
MKSAGFPARSNRLQPKGRAFYRCFEKWLYSFTDYIESEDEFEESLRLLKVFLCCEEVMASDGLGKAFSAELLEYVIKSVLTADNLNKTLFYKRMSVRDFDLRTSSNAESEGAVTKGGSTGCRPNQTIDKSADAVILMTQRRLQKKKTAAANSMHAQSVQTIRDETRSIYADISAVLTPYSANLVEKQFLESCTYLVFRADAVTFYVKRESYKEPPQQWMDPLFFTFVVPHFERTRVVTVITDKNGSSCLCCNSLLAHISSAVSSTARTTGCYHLLAQDLRVLLWKG